MAYMNQAMKAERADAVKAVLKKYGMKGTLSVQNHSTLVLTCPSGKIDFFGIPKIAAMYGSNASKYMNVNHYWIEENFGENVDAVNFLNDVKSAMNVGNHNNSDSQSDYFDVGFYININLGKWNKEYELTV